MCSTQGPPEPLDYVKDEKYTELYQITIDEIKDFGDYSKILLDYLDRKTDSQTDLYLTFSIALYKCTRGKPRQLNTLMDKAIEHEAAKRVANGK